MALRTCDCLFRNGGKNLPGFMCGRQMTVTLCFFVIARVTTINIVIGEDENIFGVADWFFAVLQRKAMGFRLDEVFVGTPEERAAKGHADDEHINDHLDLGTNIVQHAVGRHTITREYMDLVQESFANQREKVMDNITELRKHIKNADSDEEKHIFEQAMKLEISALKNINTSQSQSMRNLTAMLDKEADELDLEEGDDDFQKQPAATAAVQIKSLGSDDDL